MLFAWITLGTLILTDLYIMLVASGTISDMRFVG
ncbi:Putative succinate dehydrogenase [Mycobacteroides abscessus]|nr:Putative succinate dehydrogenase [Mycobacteroides abscessus]CQA07805.1 Putative succinate dehydrogenase [Mycobacteroides abscessus]SKU76514.1 putative succinate dehydrogenase membrane anchor subunit [Mycobacteroides abscessus subsp. abscessus]SKU89021.1 putative succinate dehydrogenase membrane anchor subunit [Mycobacteroides abscessus subsp. abscessus]